MLIAFARGRDRLATIGMILAAVALALQPDRAMAGVLDPLAVIAVVGGALLLVVPAVAGQWIDPENRAVHAVFGTVWLGTVVAAALGNYPTPLVGYGGSAILGAAPGSLAVCNLRTGR